MKKSWRVVRVGKENEAQTKNGNGKQRGKHSEVEKEARDKAAITMASNSLSYSEKEEIEHIFEELSGREGRLIA